MVVLPGTFNALSAKMAQASGFKAAYVSGAGVSASFLAKPDVGLITLKDLEGTVQRMRGASDIPLLVDADTGFGDVRRTVRILEQAGAAGIQIEDQLFPKRCGHLPGKELVSRSVMEGKVRAAVRARRDPNFLIVARTDAKAVEGLDAAVERALAYRGCGADVIFPEALESREEFASFARRVPGPLVANMTEFGKTPYLRVSEFERLGFRLVLFPMTALRAALKAMEETYRDLKKSGTQKKRLKRMMTRKELYKLLDYEVLS